MMRTMLRRGPCATLFSLSLGLALGLSLTACDATRAPETQQSPAADKAASSAPKRAGSGKAPPKGESTAGLGLRVKLELLTKLGVDGLRVDVEAQGGSVVLAGEVKKRATSELASEVARQVEGVSAVDNRIKVSDGTGGDAGAKVDKALAEAEAELADAALETRVRLRLVDRLGSDGFRIGTDAASGVLTLEFPKEMERARRRDAVKAAKRVEGVTKVVALDKE